ncbi:hypothetical protein MXD63_36720, partial [Frankia sp. Cpl3]|nr:hypothetical protein [Frankia sp. Cpl3]
IYRGNQVIPEAVHFIQQLRTENMPFLYLTNNSSASPVRVAARLTEMGLATKPDEVYTSSMATAAYLNERAGAAGSAGICDRGRRSSRGLGGERVYAYRGGASLCGSRH